MSKKKSLDEAIVQAKQISLEYPKVVVRVMDKKYSKAVVCISSWVHKERILDGWHDVIAFKNGKEFKW